MSISNTEIDHMMRRLFTWARRYVIGFGQLNSKAVVATFHKMEPAPLPKSVRDANSVKNTTIR